jgi:GNAT superfamily N-acetyltransferase
MMRIERLTSPPGAVFDAAYAIFHEALPASERKSREAIAALLDRADYRLFAGFEDRTVLAMAIVYLSPSEPFALLEYMATDRTARNRGLGAGIFRAVQAEAGARSLMMEVDSDRQNSPDRALRTRRRHFYERLGAHVIAGLDYRMPAIGAGEPPAMDLMIAPGPACTALSRDEAGCWIRDIYTGVYDRPIEPAALAAMITTMPEQVRFGPA